MVNIELKCNECGKSFEHRHSCRNREDAARYQEWAMENITTCPACYAEMKRAQERARLDKQTAEAREIIAGITLAPLTGTEKQIAWAEDIRARAAKMFQDAKAKPVAWELFNSFSEAKWWIDHREYCDETKCGVRLLVQIMRDDAEERKENK